MADHPHVHTIVTATSNIDRNALDSGPPKLAKVSDLTTQTPNVNSTALPPPSKYKHHLFEMRLGHINSPMPIQTPKELIVEPNYLDSFSAEMHEMIINALFPYGIRHTTVITAAEFTTFVRYLLKGRLDYVHSREMSVTQVDAVPYYTAPLPSSLAMLLNSIGVSTVYKQTFKFIPKPPAVPADAAAYIGTTCTTAIMTKAATLFAMIGSNDLLPLTTLSTETSGRPFWFLQPIGFNHGALQDRHPKGLSVASFHRDFDPLDVALVAVIAPTVAEVVIIDKMLYTSKPITDLHSLRHSFVFADHSDH